MSKVGVTVDEVRGTRYTLGRYDFYTRQFDMDDDLAAQVQLIEEAAALSQRILSSLYNSNGRFVTPEDKEAFKCAVEKLVPATPVQQSAKQPKQKASAVGSKLESLPGYAAQE